MADNSHTLHPKDKGWAWMIAIGSFVVDAVTVGYIRSYGLLFVAIQKQYHYSSGVVSAVIAAQYASTCTFTVLAMNVFIKKYSVRFLCIIGILLETMAVSLCNVVQNPVYIVLCLGFVNGIGQGILLFPSRYLVAVYFQKRRSLAVVIASCGASLGGIAFPIVVEMLLDVFGLQGALLMVAGILLNQLIFVITYTPPSDYGFSEHNKVISVDSGNQVVQLQQQRLVNCDNQAVGVDSESEGQRSFQRDFLLLTSSTSEGNSEGAIHGNKIGCIQKRLPSSENSSPKTSKCRLLLPDVFYSKLFWTLLPCFIGCPVALSAAYVFIPPLAAEKGLDGEAVAYLLTIASLMDIGGKLVSGILLQMGLLTPSLLTIIPMIVGCALYISTSFIQNYTGMLILATLYGPISGFFWAIQVLLIIEVLGMPMLASASGIYGAATALSFAVSYAIAGSLYDLAGTYSATFMFLTALLLIAILSLVAVKILKPKKVEAQ